MVLVVINWDNEFFVGFIDLRDGWFGDVVVCGFFIWIFIFIWIFVVGYKINYFISYVVSFILDLFYLVECFRKSI